MKNKELRAWLILAAMQLAWILPCAYDYSLEHQPEEQLLYEYEDVLRWRLDGGVVIEDEDVYVEDLDIESVKESELVSLGIYKFTAYCPCKKCSDNWGHKTSTGATATEGRTIAVDPKVIPYGTVIIVNIDGVEHEYVSEDCGSEIKNKRIDVFFESHQSALEFGVKYLEVFTKGE